MLGDWPGIMDILERDFSPNDIIEARSNINQPSRICQALAYAFYTEYFGRIKDVKYTTLLQKKFIT